MSTSTPQNIDAILLKEIAEETTRWLLTNVPSEYHTLIVAENWQYDSADHKNVIPVEQHIIGYFGDQNDSLTLEMYKAGKNFTATRFLFEATSCTEIVAGPCKCITGKNFNGWKVKSYYMPDMDVLDLSFVLCINSFVLPTLS